MTMVVENLPYKATGDSILELFGNNAKSVQIATNRFGFVNFNSNESRDAAIDKSWELDGCQLRVDKTGTFHEIFKPLF